VHDSQHLINSKEEQDYFNMVTSKLEGQLVELEEIKEKVLYYSGQLKNTVEVFVINL
jgi:hypothetical protein